MSMAKFWPSLRNRSRMVILPSIRASHQCSCRRTTGAAASTCRDLNLIRCPQPMQTIVNPSTRRFTTRFPVICNTSLQSHKLSMAQTFQEMEIMKKYFDIQQRRMRASYLEFEHLHHMLQYWENTLFHSSSSAVSATDPSYYDQPENRQHESNTVINNAELMMGVIPNFGLANIPSAATEISIADSNEADTASSSIGGSERNDRGKNTVRNSPPYAPFTGVRCFGRSGGSGGSGLLPTSR